MEGKPAMHKILVDIRITFYSVVVVVLCACSKLSSIEMFSAASNSWSHCTHTPSGARLGIAAAVVADALILVGGFNKDDPSGSDIRNTVERFDILTRKSVDPQ